MSNEDPYREIDSYSAGPYDTTAHRTPIPPPPPPPSHEWYSHPYDPYRKQKRSPWYYVLIVFLLCVIGGSVLVIWLKFNAAKTPTASATSTDRPATATTIVKPTADGSHSLFTSDYQRFIDSFSYATQNNDYAAIEQIVDTNNFQSISINTADGIASGWDLTQRELANKEITLYLRQVIITPEDDKFNCNGHFYGPTGLTFGTVHMINIPHATVKYDVGSIFSNVPGSNYPSDSVVYIFEQPNGQGQWFWRGYVFGNTPNCAGQN